jgi:hypothetical protein
MAKSDIGTTDSKKSKTGWRLSLDTWAAAFALALAVLIRLGVIKHISW